jgi:hypothetical protein
MGESNVSEELPFKIEVKPSQMQKPKGDRYTTGAFGAIGVFLLVLVFRGVIANLKFQEQQQEFQQQELQQVLNDEIRKTPPEKMGKAMKILIGIKEEETPRPRNEKPNALPHEDEGSKPPE